jgi:radical SAM protein with 4Fe4S-binding SPASM domain
MLINASDTFTLASKLNPNRVANAWKIWRSYHQSFKAKKAQINGFPISISIEPTTSCNLRCPECPSGLRSFTRPTGQLSTEAFAHFLSQIEKHLIHLTFYFQGEPFLNPDFLEMVKLASRKKLYTTTSTNAHFLNQETARKTVDSGLNRLIISIDGASQETYTAYRVGGKLEKVLQATQNVVLQKQKRNRKDLSVIWQFLVVKPNEHEIGEIKKMAKRYGVDHVMFKTAQIYDYKHGSELIPTQDRYSRYRKVGENNYVIKNEWENKCWKMWHSCVITWDGQVIPCCFDKDATHSFGNLHEQPFEDIWNSETYNNFRNALLQSRSSIDICQNCSEGLNVWA